MSKEQLTGGAIGGSALLTALLYAADAEGVVRIAMVAAFLLIGPGLAFVRLLHLRDALTVVTLAVGASIGLNVVLSAILLALNVWSPGRMIVILVVFTLVCLVLPRKAHPEAEAQQRGPSARQRAMAALAGADFDGGAA